MEEQEIGNSRVDWASILEEVQGADLSDSDLNRFMDAFSLQEGFQPYETAFFRESEIDVLIQLAMALQNRQAEDPVYFYYANVVKKLVILLLEEYPDAVDLMDMDSKRFLLMAKYIVPDAAAVFKNAYVFLNGAARLPAESNRLNLSMVEVLREINAGQRIEITQDLEERIIKFHLQYAEYFAEESL